MFRLFLAVRYVVARPVSYLAMVAIGVAIMALIVVVSVMNGFLEETRSIIRGTTADLVVFPIQAAGGGAAVPRAALERIVLAEPSVAGACSRLVRPAVFKAHEAANLEVGSSVSATLNQVLVLGIEPELEVEVTGFLHYLRDVSGADRKVDDPRHPFRLHRGLIMDRSMRNADLPRVLVGEMLMNRLRLVKGQAIDVVTVPDNVDFSGGRIRSTTETLIIAGAFSTGHQEFEMGHMFISRDAFLRWTNTSQEVSEMVVSAKEGSDLNAARDSIQRQLDEEGLAAGVETWMDRHAVWLGAVKNERNILAVVLGLFVLLTCTITFSMLTMMVQEKIRDIGILSAMGASSRGVGSVFALCGTFVATLGALAGLLAGELLAGNVNAVKDWIESSFGIQIFDRKVYAFTEIPSIVDHGLNALIAAATVVFALLICRLPAWRAARMDPVEALRHE